jgi:hypothetical protein
MLEIPSYHSIAKAKIQVSDESTIGRKSTACCDRRAQRTSAAYSDCGWRHHEEPARIGNEQIEHVDVVEHCGGENRGMTQGGPRSMLR